MSFKGLQGLWADDEQDALEALATPTTDPALLVAVGVVAGLGVGLALGMLLAPRSGAETRHALGTRLGGHRDAEPDEVDSVLGVG